MSYKATNWAYDLPLKGSMKPVLVVLADMADESHTCFPGQDRVAQMSGLTVRTVQRALVKLEAAGLIERQHRVGYGGYRTSDRYVLNVGEVLHDNLSPDTVSHDNLTSLHDNVTEPRRHSVVAEENHQLEPSEEPSDSSSDADASDADQFSAEVHELCDLLASMVKANGHPVGTVGVTWWRACERLMRIDKYKPEQIANVAKWACEQSEFWQANIRSMPTLRKQFSVLRAQAMADYKKRQGESRMAAVANVIDIGRRMDTQQGREIEQ